MLEWRTSDCLAIANTAILMRLLEELVASGIIKRSVAHAVLSDATGQLGQLSERGSHQFRRGCREVEGKGCDSYPEETEGPYFIIHEDGRGYGSEGGNAAAK